MGSRLCLDEAVKQAQQHQQVDPEKAFEGWSEARIYAYRMIDENPNSYYYRFNAPGEVQRRGQWSKVTFVHWESSNKALIEPIFIGGKEAIL